ncbi:hypothetical protein [Methylobacterium sp. 88A]|uniref:hypothetical protein n=1 Tax=Methylobacterium sp. 88A TaxID=1131813 RepID=UPI0012F655E4|nr:hypothetical protein [Methylobacterium sp. 88A]
MTEYSYLIYFTDPYGVGKSQYVVANEVGLTNVPKNTLKDYDRLITFDVHTLVDDLRINKGSLPAELIDISDALRLNAAVSRSDGGEKVWGFWRNIKPHFKNQASWKILSGVYSVLDPIPESSDLPALLSEFVVALGLLWNDTKDKLELNGELARFLDVEVPVAQIFYYR